MLDLWLALILMTLMGMGLFLVTHRLCGKLKLWGLGILATMFIALTVGFGVWLLDSRWVLKILPFQEVIVYGNLLIPFSALIAGVMWKMPNRPIWRRLIFSAPMIVVAYGYSLNQMLAKTPPCGDKWDKGVCLQTRQASCVAAAGATLLYYHGFDTTEKEMAHLCLTTERGTYLHGLYRGLKIKTKRVPIHVLVGKGDVEDLRRKMSLPLLLYVKLSEQVNERDERYARDWGWIVGVVHTVVLFRFTDDGRLDIGDPGAGREYWDLQALQDLWQGQYVCLKKEN